MNGDPLLFALNASRDFGEAVSRQLGVGLAAHEERAFEDGEHKGRPLVSVRDRDVYVIQSLYGDAKASADDKLTRLLFFLGALKDAAAARLTAVVPYLAYSRKDRRSKPRDPVTTRYIATLLEAMGTDCVLTLDVHNLAAYQNAFRCRSEHLEAASLFVEHLKPLLGDDDAVVVSPDAGGIKRADAFRQRLVVSLGREVGAAFAEKYRSGGVVSGEALAGDVAGKVAVIVDDLICAGTTVARATRHCREHGAARVLAVASHGVFADAANTVLGESDVERIVVTDTIPPWRVSDARLKSKLHVLSSAGLFAEAIRRLHSGGSIGELNEG
ncbi:MAG TPA: ribose-phosphate pyrophosphokinase [Casimicrobiaceae bacterium]|nr:ribose-phosphate pyrophosphokinase [Casimicrobiaceae bacterium]